MSVFADTSALYALLDRDDRFHVAAAATWKQLLTNDEPLVTSNYVILECFALVQRRLGMDAVRDLATRLLPLLTTEWIGDSDHELAEAALLAAGRRDISFVDFASFQVMRRTDVVRAFTFDPHFTEQGLQILPGA